MPRASKAQVIVCVAVATGALISVLLLWDCEIRSRGSGFVDRSSPDSTIVVGRGYPGHPSPLKPRPATEPTGESTQPVDSRASSVRHRIVVSSAATGRPLPGATVWCRVRDARLHRRHSGRGRGPCPAAPNRSDR